MLKRSSPIIEQWKRDWLYPLSGVLDGPRAEELDALVAEYDVPRPRFQSGGFRQVQDHSPTDVANFKTMSVPELVQYLKDWTPPSTELPFEQPSRAGMAATLRNWIVENPDRATSNLEQFFTTELDPATLPQFSTRPRVCSSRNRHSMSTPLSRRFSGSRKTQILWQKQVVMVGLGKLHGTGRRCLPRGIWLTCFFKTSGWR